jgi:hypothetical protein
LCIIKRQAQLIACPGFFGIASGSVAGRILFYDPANSIGME